ncbi:MAG: hypothetical protein O7H41_11030 [Planctomycetota bacterium]|nr:hypothetical protein [Planctomycetota bacterium]
MKPADPMKATPGGSAIRWGLSLSGGALLALAFGIPSSFLPAILAPFVLLPWIVLFSRRGLRAPAWMILPGAYLFAILAGSNLVAAAPLPGLLMPFIFVPFVLPFSVVLRGWPEDSSFPVWLAAAFAWVGAEWIRCTFSAGSIEIYLLGHTLAGIPLLIQVADILGSYGVSFLVALASSAVTFELLDRWPRPASGPVAGAGGRWLRRGVAGGGILMAILYGVISLSTMETTDGPRVYAVRIGPSTEGPRAREKRYVERTYRSVPQDGTADLIVWPKDAVADVYLYDPDYTRDMRNLGNWFECPFLIGARNVQPRYRDTFRNVVVHVTPEGQPAREYSQMLLLPGLEYGPLERQMRRLEAGGGEWAGSLERASRWLVKGWLDSVPRLDPGRRLLTFDLRDDLSYGAPLGSEIMSHGWCRGAREKGAEFLISLDRSRIASARHDWAVLRSATFRAVENRISVLRIEEGGLSYLIDPAGRLRQMSSGGEASGPAFQVDIPILAKPAEPAPFGGELFGRLAAALTVLLLGGVLMRRGAEETRERKP